MYITTSDKILLLIGLITGATVTFGFTIMNNQKVNEAGHTKNFFHPYIQVAIRSLSNSLCFIPVVIKGIKYQEGKNRFLNPLKILIPTVLDFFSSYCFYTALNFMPGSVYQMLRGGTVLTTYAFTIFMLKIRPKKFKIVGCIIVLVGLAVIGVVNFINGEEDTSSSLAGIGYGLILLGIIGSGWRFVYEEKIIRKFNVAPLWLLGIQGVYSAVLSCIFIPILAVIPCPFQDNACVFNDAGDKVIQNATVFFRQLPTNDLIIAGFVISMLSSCFYNGIGVTIAKSLSSLARAIIDVSRTIIVWIVGVILTVSLGQNDQAWDYESLDAWTLVGQSIGFLLLITGNFIYYQIIAFNCLFQNQTICTQMSKEYMLDPGLQPDSIVDLNQPQSPLLKGT